MTEAIQLTRLSDLQRVDHLRQQVDKDGMTRFRVNSRQEFLELSTEFGELFVHRDADPDAITVVKHDPERAGLDGYAALTAGPLKPHTDGSGNLIAPKYVALWCFRNEGVGGECTMADGQAVINDLLAENPWVVDRLSAKNAAIFKSGADRYDGPVVWNDGQQWRIRLRLDSNGFFSTETLHAIEVLREAIAARTFTFPLESGDGYVIDNQRYIHGRLTFSGTREMLRALMI